MDYVKDFLKPELLVLIPVIYFIGMGLKKSESVKNQYIPILLGVSGIALATLYTFATSQVDGFQSVMMAIFTSLTQGVLVAGCSVYIDQIIKQQQYLKQDGEDQQ